MVNTQRVRSEPDDFGSFADNNASADAKPMGPAVQVSAPSAEHPLLTQHKADVKTALFELDKKGLNQLSDKQLQDILLQGQMDSIRSMGLGLAEQERRILELLKNKSTGY